MYKNPNLLLKAPEDLSKKGLYKSCSIIVLLGSGASDRQITDTI